jgi:hypothetical protein
MQTSLVTHKKGGQSNYLLGQLRVVTQEGLILLSRALRSPKIIKQPFSDDT